MRARYSSVAALIVLVFAAILISINAVASVQSTNRMSTQALASTCRLSAVALDSAASSGVDELEALASYAELNQYDFCLFDKDGKVKYTNCVQDVALDEVDYSHIGTGELENGTVRLKNMETGEQTETALDAESIAAVVMA